ncbi:pentatricopeptide repeat-containing protein, partial [Striga asiatica]
MVCRAIALPRDRNFFLGLIKLANTLSHLNQTHAQIIHNNLVNDTQTITKLIQKLLHLRANDQAKLLFSGINSPDLVLYNVLIKGFRSNPFDSLSVYEDLLWKTNFRPDNFTYISFFGLFWLSDSLIRENRGFASWALCSFRFRVFDGIPEPDTVLWNTILSGLAKNCCYHESLRVFHDMVGRTTQFDSTTLAVVLSALAKLQEIKTGMTVQALAVKVGCHYHDHVLTCLVCLYSKCGDIFTARLLFSLIRNPDLVAYNAKISGFSANNEYAMFLELFQELLLSGRKLISSTIVGLIPVFYPFGHLDFTHSIHSFCLKSGFLLNPSVSTALTTVYSRLNELDLARDIFDESSEKTLASWNAMISGYTQNGQTAMALSLFHKMQKLDIQPNPVTITSILSACAQFGALALGKWVHELIKKQSEPNIYVSTALIDMYMKCGSINEAESLFHIMEEKNIVTWNAMISGYGLHGHGREALKLYNEMPFWGQRIFGTMVYDHGFEPSSEHYTCMVDIFGRAGKLEDALKFINEMPIKPGPAEWGALLGACMTHKNASLAQLASDRLFELDPENVGYRVLLSNIYCTNNNYSHAALLRQVVKKKNLGKTPGCTLIEINGLQHVFTSGDKSHPDSVVIYNMLEKLMGKMKDAGYLAETVTPLHDVEEEEKELMVSVHSEILAIAFGIMMSEEGEEIRIIKNLRTAIIFTKFICRITERTIIVRDAIMLIVSRGKWHKLDFTSKASNFNVLHSSMVGRAIALPRDRNFFLGLIKQAITLSHLNQTHAQIIHNNLVNDTQTITKLIQKLLHLRANDQAKLLFSGINSPDLFLYNVLIKGFRSNPFDSLSVYEDLLWKTNFRPDNFTYSFLFSAFSGYPTPLSEKIGVLLHGHSVVSALAELQEIKTGMTVQALAVKVGCHYHGHVLTCLVCLYSKCGDIFTARLLFSLIRNPDLVAYNAMISGFSANNEYAMSLELFRELLSSGRKLSSSTMVGLIPVFYPFGHLDFTQSIHSFCLKSGFLLNPSVSTALTTVYSRLNELDLAREIFDESSEKTLASWNAMISGYTQNGQTAMALSLFHKMQKLDIQPNPVTITSILSACAQFGALGLGKWVHELIKKQSYEPNIYVSTALIDMYMKCGSINEAESLFHIMEEKNIVTWNAMISGYGLHGHGREALKLYNEMLLSGVNPTRVTFLSILYACSHAGMVAEGQRIFDAMVYDHGFEPSSEHYTCMVDIFGRAGKLEDALKFINEMPKKPGPAEWGALLGACMTHKNASLAQLASDQLFELDPENVGYRVLLSNIYSTNNNYSHAALLRQVVKKKNLGKTPGCTLIEINGLQHVFTSGDKSHPDSVAIYNMLEKLMGKMKDAGYLAETVTSLHDVEEEEKELMMSVHSEKLAIAFGIMMSEEGEEIRIIKNLRVCLDCHNFTKFMCRITERTIIVRDANRFHHFEN